jgi:hypothetical protein
MDLLFQAARGRNMTGTPVEIVRRVLSDPTNPAGGTWTINSDPDGHTIEV